VVRPLAGFFSYGALTSVGEFLDSADWPADASAPTKKERARIISDPRP
jgi:hypothetical protein